VLIFGRRHLRSVLAEYSPLSTVQLWNVASHRLIGAIQTRQAPFNRGLAFSPNGRLLATSSPIGPVVRLWNVPRDTLEASFTASSKTIWSMSYSDSLDVIVTADSAVTRVWRTDPSLVAADVCRTLRAPVPSVYWRSYLPGVPYMKVCA
jgi:WD40 repeat protein